MTRRRIAVVVKGYPRLSETFIAQEILGLERRGLEFVIVSLRRPTDPAIHDLHRSIQAPVLYLPEYLHEEPARVARAWLQLRRHGVYPEVRRLWLRDLTRERSRNRLRRFGQALVLARELPADTGMIYAHYLHTPASVARYAARLLRLPLAVAAHAKDIWTSPEWEKQEKLREVQWLTTCTAAGADHLRALVPAARVLLNYHGLDLTRFPAPARTAGADGSDRDRPVEILGIARLVPKKGLDVLLDALARLPADLHWRYTHIGHGPLAKPLRAESERLGLADRITWLGALPQERVVAACRTADLFVLANRIAPDGDRDGLPNVLMEAGSQELAVVASRVAAVPELIEDGQDGRLVPPDDPQALADVLDLLSRSPDLRLRLGGALRRKVLERFAAGPGLDAIARELRTTLNEAQARAA